MILLWEVDHVGVADPFTAPSSASTEKLRGLVDELLMADTGLEQVIAQAIWLDKHASRRPHPTVQSALRPMLCQRGNYTMDSFSVGMESDVKSELIDLSTVSMTVLRELDDTVLRQAVRHVMQQTAHPRVSSGTGSAERVD